MVSAFIDWHKCNLIVAEQQRRRRIDALICANRRDV
jgi:hypothetical protein